MISPEIVSKLANYVDVTFKSPKDEIAAQQLIRCVYPQADCRLVCIKVLDDGLSNQLILLTCDRQHPGQSSSAQKLLLVRIYGQVTNSLIDRTMELLCMTALHTHRGTPKVYAVFNNGIAYAFIPGSTIPPADLGAPKYWRLIASELAQFHCLLVRDPLIEAYRKSTATPGERDSPPKCMIFSRLRAWIALLKTKLSNMSFTTHRCRLPSIPALLHEIDEMESMLQCASTPVVVCHNDLLAGNIILSADNNSVHFIDLEFSGFAHAAADIGNHFCEYAGVDHPDYTKYPRLPFQRDWITCYLQHIREHIPENTTPTPNGLTNGDHHPMNGDLSCLIVQNDDSVISTSEVDRWLREVNYFALVSHLTWAVWAAVRSCDNEHQFDFPVYSTTRLNEYHRFKKIVLATFVEGRETPKDFVIT